MADSHWDRFVNVRLESTHKEAIKALVPETDDETLVSWLFTVLDDGYKFSLSPDDEHGAVIATLTGKDGKHNVGLSMSQRHSDPKVAIVALMFAHETICSGEDWETAEYNWKEVDW